MKTIPFIIKKIILFSLFSLFILFIVQYKYSYAINAYIRNEPIPIVKVIKFNNLDTNLNLNITADTNINIKKYALFDIVDIAKYTDNQFLSNKKQIEISAEKINQAKSGLYPQINLQVSGGINKDYINNASNNNLTKNIANNLNIKQNLYNKNIYLDIEKSKLNLSIDNIKTLLSENELILKCATSYFESLNILDKIELVKLKISNLEEQYTMANRNLSLGTGVINEVYEAKSRLDQALAESVILSNSLTKQIISLNKFLGKYSNNFNAQMIMDNGINLVKIKSLNILKIIDNLDNYVNNAKIFQTQISNLNIELANNSYQKAKALYLPSIELTASASNAHSYYAQNIGINSAHKNSANIVIGINIPIFSGYEHSSKVNEGALVLQKSILDKNNIEQNMNIYIDELKTNIKNLVLQYNVLDSAKKSALLTLKANYLSYKSGLKINIDVLNSQEQVFKIDTDIKNTQYDIILTWIKLQSLSNILSSENMKFIEYR